MPPSMRSQPSCARARAMPRPIPRVPPVMSARRLLITRSKEREVRLPLGEALDIERRFPRVVVAPLTRLAARRLRAGWHVIPPIRPVVDRVQQQPLMAAIDAQIRV